MTGRGMAARMELASVPKELTIRKFVISAFVGLQIFIFALGLYYDSFYSPALSEQAQFYFMAVFMFMAIQLQLVTVIFPTEACGLINTIFIFCAKLRKILKFTIWQKIC